MKNKLYLLGIDGLSFQFITDHLEDLPNFKELFELGNCKGLNSVFPPDSIPAWIAIFTGLLPAEHGVLDSIDYLDETKNQKIPSLEAFKGKTFWDILSAREKRVCIINPFLAFPVWNVNGFFVNGSVFTKDRKIDANDRELIRRFPLPTLGGLTTFPKKTELSKFIDDSYRETKALSDYAKQLYNHDDYDLFFISYFTMDRFQHFLWRYSDDEDMTHPKNNHHISSILDFYKFYDEIVGDIKSSLKDGEAFVVISDHGHGRRCTHVLNINEVLRKKGLYFVDTKKIKIFDKKYLIERLKNIIIEIVFKYNLEDIFYTLSKRIPNRKAIKKGEHLKSSKNIAEACSMFGTNPFGGIRIDKENILPDRSYEEVRNDIIRMFSLYKHNNKHIFTWIKKREDVCSGRNIGKYADILFEMNSDYGVSWSVFTKEVGFNTTHKKISGGHEFVGCFFTYNLEKKYFDRVESVNDIYNLVTTCLDS